MKSASRDGQSSRSRSALELVPSLSQAKQLRRCSPVAAPATVRARERTTTAADDVVALSARPTTNRSVPATTLGELAAVVRRSSTCLRNALTRHGRQSCSRLLHPLPAPAAARSSVQDSGERKNRPGFLFFRSLGTECALRQRPSAALLAVQRPPLPCPRLGK